MGLPMGFCVELTFYGASYGIFCGTNYGMSTRFPMRHPMEHATGHAMGYSIEWFIGVITYSVGLPMGSPRLLQSVAVLPAPLWDVRSLSFHRFGIVYQIIEIVMEMPHFFGVDSLHSLGPTIY